ncbi:hypothetical protein SETIT_9G498100v2 [Setaria italica]|uniref:Uncharacterized protein n=2 Tax=Setaria TaxID=4554 RepID=K4AJW7_SETIT|nr:hypothetical protein SETIT_9G498100v2 [Setaria italica]TKV97561.1 hypothetical protein SEVIR_9G502500v2 [Setaria viridis]
MARPRGGGSVAWAEAKTPAGRVHQHLKRLNKLAIRNIEFRPAYHPEGLYDDAKSSIYRLQQCRRKVDAVTQGCADGGRGRPLCCSTSLAAPASPSVWPRPMEPRELQINATAAPSKSSYSAVMG